MGITLVQKVAGMSMDSNVSWNPALNVMRALEGLQNGDVSGDTAPCYEDQCDPLEFNADTTLFAQGNGDQHAVDPNDVKQNGSVANCYLMASIAAVAEQNPQYIQDMIQDNGDGTYTVTLHEYDKGGLFGTGFLGSGEWKPVEVTVTADFPESGSGLSGDKDADGAVEIWPQLIEKAYAELSRGGSDDYANLDYGDATDALGAILGDSNDWSSMEDYSFEQLQTDFDAGNAIVASTPKMGDVDSKHEALFSQHSLANNHVYSVSNVYVDGDGVQMVELNNPWGHGHVTMPYEDAQALFSRTASVSTD